MIITESQSHSFESKGCGQIGELGLMQSQVVRGSSAHSSARELAAVPGSSRFLGDTLPTPPAGGVKASWTGGYTTGSALPLEEEIEIARQRDQERRIQTQRYKPFKWSASAQLNTPSLLFAFPLHLTFTLIWSKSGNEIYRKGQQERNLFVSVIQF